MFMYGGILLQVHVYLIKLFIASKIFMLMPCLNLHVLIGEFLHTRYSLLWVESL